LKTDPKERIGLKQMLLHPFFTKVTPYNDFMMITPKEQTEEDTKIFVVSEDIPLIKKVGIKERKNTEILKKLQEAGSAPGSGSSNNVTVASSNESSLQNNLEYEKLKLKYDKAVNRVEELENYSSELKNKYERLYKEFNELKTRVIGFDKEKENYLKELDDKANEILNLKKRIYELNDKIEEKENKVKILAKTIKIVEEKNDKLDEQLKKVEDDFESYKLDAEKEKKQRLEQISTLEGKLIFSIDNYHENRISNLRESITNLNQNSVFASNYNESNSFAKDKENDFQEHLNKAKEQFMCEIEDMKKGFLKEKENFVMMIKNKDEIIRKFEDEKKTLKASVEKSQEMKIYKLNLQLSTKDAEIEKLNAKLKKYENQKK
jgi:chromosome segregation ATPase